MKDLKRVFIKEAKKMIKHQGLEGLSVRKIGKASGYSYATIYNYFTDLNELLSYCTIEVLEECQEFVELNSVFTDDSFANVIAFSETYFEYFVENPNYFQLVFLENIGDYLTKLMKENKTPIIGNILHNQLLNCYKKGLIEASDVATLRGLISTSIHGRLLLFLRKRDESKIDIHLNSLKKELSYLFR